MRLLYPGLDVKQPHPHRPDPSPSSEKTLRIVDVIRHDQAWKYRFGSGWQDEIGDIHTSMPSADTRIAYRLYRAALSLAECVDIDPERRSGVPVLKGTRFPISQVIAQLAEGDSVASLIDDFDLDGNSLRLFLMALSDFLARPIDHEMHSI